MAKALYSLNHCREAGKGHLRCCLQLLFIWTVSHLVERKISGLLLSPGIFTLKWITLLKDPRRNANMGGNVLELERVLIPLENSLCIC